MEGGNMEQANGSSHAAQESLQTTVQGKVTGIIYPPPDIRAVVDKTAQFVARNGRSFERKIVGETMSAKFSFLRENDPYHSYYEHKVTEFTEKQAKETEEQARVQNEAATAAAEPTAQPLEAGATSSGAKPAPTSQDTQQQVSEKVQEIASKGDVVVQKQAVEDVTAKFAKKAKEKPRTAPLKEQFTLKHPNLTALDQEIMYLTAQYTALNGKSFLSGLATREQRNPQFDFLKPTHALFAYFTQLVESYTQVLQLRQRLHEQKHKTKPKRAQDPAATSAEEDPKNDGLLETTSRMKVLDRCVQQLEFLRLEQEAKDAEAAADDAEKLALARIDWQDFVIVETITFDDDDESDTHASWQDADGTAAGDKATKDAAESDDDMDMDMDMEDDDEEEVQSANVKVVEDYVPLANEGGAGAVSSGTGAGATSFVSVDGKAIPSDQANEHMRILLMNPKWREETQRHLEKQKETSYAAGVAIADSLKRFAKKRADIFASSAEEEARLLQATMATATTKDKPAGSAEAQDMQEDDEDDDDDERQPADYQQEPTADMVPPNQFAAPSAGFAPPGTVGAPGMGVTGGAPGAFAPSVSAPMVGTPMVGAYPPGVAPPGVGAPGVGIPPGMGMAGPPGCGAPGLPPGIPGAPGVPGVSGAPSLHHQQMPPGAAELAVSGPNELTEEPAAKRQRTDNQLTLLTEDEFAALHPGNVRLEIKVPNESDKNSPWKLDGQTLSVEVDVKAPMRAVKQQLVELLGGMPVNKQQLKTPVVGFVKDTLSSAHYNFVSGTTLELSVRQRGGRR